MTLHAKNPYPMSRLPVSSASGSRRRPVWFCLKVRESFVLGHLSVIPEQSKCKRRALEGFGN